MIDSCAKARNPARAEAWHERMVERGIAGSPHTFSSIINALAKQGGPGAAEAAETWLDRSEQVGVVPDVVLYSTVINAYGRNHDADGALRIFNRMQASGIRPHVVAYATIARAFAQRGNWRRVEGFAADMSRDGVAVNDFFLYAQLLSFAVSRQGQPDRAEACFRSALASGVRINDRVADVLARAVGPERCGELIEELCSGREACRRPRRAQGGLA